MASMKWRKGLGFVLVLLVVQQTGLAVRVAGLRCEQRENPVGVGVDRPRLSWRLESEDPAARSERQGAYQVLVASRPELLAEGRADLWDSGKRESAESLHVGYEGKGLAGNQAAYWTVRVWDAAGKASAWAPRATWVTGLPAERWTAKWVGADAGDGESPLAGAKWIWAHEAEEKAGSATAPPGVRFFRRTFELPAGKAVRSATLVATADNEAVIYLNGQRVGTVDDWRSPVSLNVGHALKAGEPNVIQVKATNGTDKPNPAGLIARLSVELEGGTPLAVQTDKAWQASAKPADFPEQPQADAGAQDWVSAREVGNWGMRPWGSVGTEGPVIPMFRKGFELAKPVKRAVVNVSGLGHYKMWVNGRAVSDTVLDPPWSRYEKTVYYDTYDVTELVKRGENAVGVMLAKGYYNTLGDRRIHVGVFDRPLVAIVQGTVEYEDGTKEEIRTDGSWKWAPSPYTHNSIIGGPSYDARLLPDGWASAGFDDGKWRTVRVVEPGVGKLVAAESPVLKGFDVFKPKSVDEVAPGAYVYDFGQNASATLRVTARGKAGQTIRLTYAEQRQGADPHQNNGKGKVDQSGIRSPNYFEYTLKGGGEETWYCDLFYSGFQYVQLDGGVPAGRENSKGMPELVAIESVHVRSSAATVGRFECSNEMYERIDRTIDWAVRSNLSHVLTDCPHREKLGWLEVPHLMWASLAYRYDLGAFGPKVCRDIRDTQEPNGMIPTVAPSFDPAGAHFGGFNNPFGYTPEWGAAGVLIPMEVYRWYGDRRCLEDNFACMKGYVDFMKSTCKDGLVPKGGLGDWYDYGHGERPGLSRYTPVELTGMAIFKQCADAVAEAAQVLGKTEDAAAYQKLAGAIAKDFNDRYYTGNGVYKNTGSCQTANAMALVTGIVPEADRAAVADAIVADLEKRSWQQTSGDVGFHYLVRALSDNGKSAAIFKILDRTDVGSYGYLVNNGWTSLPEAWDADRHSSMNHCMLGHIQEWFLRDLVGIRQDERSVGFKTFHVSPEIGASVNAAKGTYESPYGTIAAAWKVENARFMLDVTVPPGTHAVVHLPAGSGITEGGMPVEKAKGVESVERGADGVTLVRVGSGTYKFECPR